MNSRVFVIAVGAVLTAPAFAECPNSLPVEQLVDCIVAEGGGQTYAAYLKEAEENVADSSKEARAADEAIASTNE